MEGAQKNLDTEIPHWDFDRTRQELNSIWEQRLSQVTVQTNNRNDKEKFYGALYRASFLPRTFNDVDGRYPSFPQDTRSDNQPTVEITMKITVCGILTVLSILSQYPDPKESRRHDAIIGGQI